MYGFQFISDTGAAIEQAAEKSNVDASRDRVGKLSNYLDGIDAAEKLACFDHQWPSLNLEVSPQFAECRINDIGRLA
jgi:hypothetical protein